MAAHAYCNILTASRENSQASQLLAKESSYFHTKTYVEMFKRKLTALDYHNPGGFDCTGEPKHFKELFNVGQWAKRGAG